MLISTTKLVSILDDPHIILVDTRSFGEYTKGHIPGAVHLDLFAFHWIDTTRYGIENFNNQSRALLSFLGVSPENKVIFYDSVSGMLAARGVWLLLYFSHYNAVMLDGGITKWQQENLPLEIKSNGFKPSKFSGPIDSKVITGFEYLQDHLDDATIIDARSPEEYAGNLIRAARSGHIPNSINIDWNYNINEDGTLKSYDDLSKIYEMPKDAEIITYCHGGYRAANTFLALKTLRFDNVKVYLGSWGEWGNNMDLPIAK